MAKKEKKLSPEKLERIRTKDFFDCIALSARKCFLRSPIMDFYMKQRNIITPRSWGKTRTGTSSISVYAERAETFGEMWKARCPNTVFIDTVKAIGCISSKPR